MAERRGRCGVASDRLGEKGGLRVSGEVISAGPLQGGSQVYLNSEFRYLRL